MESTITCLQGQCGFKKSAIADEEVAAQRDRALITKRFQVYIAMFVNLSTSRDGPFGLRCLFLKLRLSILRCREMVDRVLSEVVRELSNGRFLKSVRQCFGVCASIRDHHVVLFGQMLDSVDPLARLVDAQSSVDQMIILIRVISVISAICVIRVISAIRVNRVFR
jgi:hypothetical protein